MPPKKKPKKKKPTEKYEFLKGMETVYSSSLDIFGAQENRAFAKCMPEIINMLSEFGWDSRLRDLSKEKLKRLLIVVVLEFERWMKEEQLPEGETPLFFGVDVTVDLPKEEIKIPPQPPYIPPPSKTEFTVETSAAATTNAPNSLMGNMKLPPRPRTGPITDEDVPWENPTPEEMEENIRKSKEEKEFDDGVKF